jgi:hypothetical protein
MTKYGKNRLATAKLAVIEAEDKVYDLQDELRAALLRLMDARRDLSVAEDAHAPDPWKEV